jgi:hypothetical protein
VLDPWQELILQDAMGERSDATWAAKRVGVCVPRQNGKSQLLVARALAGALLFGERKIVISAHQADTARESFTKLQEIFDADGNGWITERIKPGGIMSAINREAVRFRSGATIQFKARTGAGSRGFSSDCLMLDEAQILPQRAWVSINSTMSAMPNPQVWLLGTPPTPEDDGAVFGAIRAAAHAGTATATAWLEWAADPDADPALDETRWSANPAWNTRINHEIVQGEYETYPPDRFALDRLGVWTNDARSSIFPTWATLATDAPPAPGALGVAATVGQQHLSLSAAAGDFIGSVLRMPVASGRAAFVAEVARIARESGVVVAIQSKSPAWFLKDDLESAGVRLHVVDFDGFATACATVREAVEAGRLRHGGHADLDAAVLNAAWRTVNDRAVISRKAGDVDALEAAILAHQAAAGPTREFWGAIG